ncbi:MFS family permease [Arthrobacter sp. UYCu712]
MGRTLQPLWRNRDFLLASSARFAATAGMGAVVVSVMLHLQNLAAAGQTPVAGPWLVAAYLLCSALPLVLLAPWAGRLADTRDSRTLATASSIVSGRTRAGSIAALALSGLLGALLPVRLSFLVAGAGGVLVALAVAAYVLPRFGHEGAQPSGGQQEAVADQVPHLAEQRAAERPGVETVVAAQESLEGADDLPDGQIAVAR